jgi:hypothetical protein
MTRYDREGKTGARTAMDAEYPVLDHDGEREVVEHVRKVGPDARRAIFSDTLGVEAV